MIKSLGTLLFISVLASMEWSAFMVKGNPAGPSSSAPDLTSTRNPCKSKSKTVPHESYCDKYYICVNDQAVSKDCPNGLVFTGRGSGGAFPFSSPCEYDFNVDCSGRPKRTLTVAPSHGQQSSASASRKSEQINPCDAKGKIVADVTYCDRYWECIQGVPELYDCPNGLAFAGRNKGVADGCDYPWRGNYCEGKQLANPPISTEHCDWLYGIFGHETSCTRYWTCWNGTSTEQLCIGGLLYNEDTHACDWPENVPGCQKHPLCKDDPNGNVPLGKSCNRYWNCQGGYPRLQRCPAMLVFDKRSLRCVVPPTEDCDVPSTTPPPPEELEDEPQDQRGQGGPRPSQSRPVPQGRPAQQQQQQNSQVVQQQQQYQQQRQQQQPSQQVIQQQQQQQYQQQQYQQQQQQ